MAKQTRDSPLMELAGEKTGQAKGQAARFIRNAQGYRNEAIAQERKRRGRSTHAIHLGRPQTRGRFVGGKFVWEKVG